MLFYSLITYKAPIYNKIVYYPSAAIAVAWLYGISSSMPVPAYAAYLLFYKSREEELSLMQVNVQIYYGLLSTSRLTEYLLQSLSIVCTALCFALYILFSL